MSEEPHPEAIQTKEKWIPKPEHKEKVKKIVQFFGFDKGIEDVTNRLFEAARHAPQEFPHDKEKRQELVASSLPADPSNIVDLVFDCMSLAKNRESYRAPFVTCRHQAYLLRSIIEHHYNEECDIVNALDGSEVVRRDSGKKLKAHTLVYHRKSDTYHDPSAYKTQWYEGKNRPAAETPINIAKLTAKQAGVPKKSKD